MNIPEEYYQLALELGIVDTNQDDQLRALARLLRRRDDLDQLADEWRHYALYAERRISALRGVITRMKRRGRPGAGKSEG